MEAAQGASQHFLYANLTAAQSKQDVLEAIAQAFMFPAHFGKNLDALYDCMTDLVHKSGAQPGFVVVLEQLPDNPRFDREAREQLLDVPPEAFEPPPRVDSAVVRMLPLPLVAGVDAGLLGELVRVAFSQRRDLLRRTLGRWLEERRFGGEFNVQRRAEEVPVSEYLALAATLSPK